MAVLPFDTDELIEICHDNDVAMLGVFGSAARGKATEQSDVDLLVRLEREISTALGRNVDLLTEAAISPYLRERIERDLQVIYEA